MSTFKQLLEARKIPKSFVLANGIKVDFTTKKNLLGYFSDFKGAYKDNYDTSDTWFHVLTKNNKEIVISEDDFKNINASDVKSLFMVYSDGYVISDINDVEFRYTKTDTPIDWDIIQNVTKVHGDIELYFK